MAKRCKAEKKFVPTAEEMARIYDIKNEELFDGALGKCDFGLFTTGKGSEGGTLGWFKIGDSRVKRKRNTRQMYTKRFGHEELVDKTNFYDICRPRIELNGNYKWSEKGMVATMVHEMCHYYTCMNGYAPARSHGREFYEIGRVVSERSNGELTIERLVKAEQLSELSLDKKLKAKKTRRTENKKSKLIVILQYLKDGRIWLSTTTSERLITYITMYEMLDRRMNLSLRSQDPELVDFLVARGFKTALRTYKYADVTQQKWAQFDNIKKYEYTILLGKEPE